MKRCILLTLLMTGTIWAQPKPAAPSKIQVLIITGQNAHNWRATTPVLRQYLEDTGKFEVRVIEEYRGMRAETLAPYDAVVLNVSNYRRPQLDMDAQAQNALAGYVKSGKGLVVYHFAASAFESWEEYDKFTGGVWRQGQGGHSKAHDFTVDIKDKEHPITRGLAASFPQKNDELYANLRMQPDNRVLATAWDDPALERGSGKHQPMLWVRSYGSGRVFSTMLGHDAEAIKSPGFISTFVRGTEWAATGNVTIPPLAEVKGN